MSSERIVEKYAVDAFWKPIIDNIPRSAQYNSAEEYARELHRKQKRKDGYTIYSEHLIKVGELILFAGGSSPEKRELEAIAGLLHDSIEDQKRNRPNVEEEIRSFFGDEVLGIVKECTIPEHGGKAAFLASLSTASRSAHVVVLADNVQNSDALIDVNNSQANIIQWASFTLPQLSDYQQVYESIPPESQPLLHLILRDNIFMLQEKFQNLRSIKS